MIIKYIKPKKKITKANHAKVKDAVNYVFNKSVENIADYALNKDENHWMVNLPNHKELAIKKMQETQACNSRVKSEKIYHYVFSFRENEQIATPILKNIEQEISSALGFNEHQRMVAVHKDTNNMHVHVVINKIHPKNFLIHNPSFHYQIMRDIANKLELKFNLEKDNHQFNLNKEKSAHILNVEKHSGLETFTSFLKGEFKAIALQANNWQELHQACDRFNITIKARGNGFIFESACSKFFVKASSIDRNLSKGFLNKKYGEFLPKENHHQQQEKSYIKKPLHANSKNIFKQYVEQKNASKEEKQQCTLAYKLSKAFIQQTYQQKLNSIECENIDRLQKTILKKQFQIEKNAKILEHQKNYRHEMGKFKEKSMGWTQYLIHEAKENPEALKALQSILSKKTQIIHADTIKSNQVLSRVLEYFPNGIISKNGEVFYRTDDNGIFKTTTQGIELVKTSDLAIAQALEVAKKCFGKELRIIGSEKFVKQAEHLAKNMAVDVQSFGVQRE